MSMHNGIYHLSNSEMNDWETMCPLVWKAKYIDKLPEFEEETTEVTAMDWGVEFETLVIGSGVGGRMIAADKRTRMKNSDYYPRIQQQAKDCRSYFKLLGGKIISRQEYIYTEITNSEGQVIHICGGLDVLYGFADPQRRNIIIDLKMPGNNESDFGKYQFGTPDKVNPQQGVHYKILHRAAYGEESDFQYWVFDRTPSMNQKRIGIEVSEITEALHIEKVSRIYNEITFAMSMNDWGFKNSFNNCRECPVKCSQERILPDLIEITA